jgi:hypothetical protein
MDEMAAVAVQVDPFREPVSDDEHVWAEGAIEDSLQERSVGRALL